MAVTTMADVTRGGTGVHESGLGLDLKAMDILFKKYGKENGSWGRHEKNVLRDEIPVELFPDDPDVLDDLGLTKQRKDMTEAQNKMIQLKNEIAIRLEKGDIFPEIDRSKSSPFDYTSEQSKISDADVSKRRELMENALKAPAISDPEFRALTEEYLDLLIPAAKKKKREMVQEINTLEAEYAQLQHEYKRKISKARADLKQFMTDLDDVTMKRFQLTDTGKASEGGLPPVEMKDLQFWKLLWISGSKYAIDRLEWFRDRIAEMDKPVNEEELREMIRSSWTAPIKDASGSAAPIGGVLSSLFGKRG